MSIRIIAIMMAAAVAFDGKSFATTQLEEVALPAVPAELREPQARADYIIVHFWDSVAPQAGMKAYSRQAIEQAFSNLISVFPYAGVEARTEAAKAYFAIARGDADDLSVLSAIADKYLYNPDSPVASDEYYEIFLTELLANPTLDEAARVRPLWNLEIIRKNRPGSKAPDFPFITREGAATSLYEVLAHLPMADTRVMLIFYDPDCDHCRETIDGIIADRQTAVDVADSRLAIVAVYSGEERELWESTATSLPAEWTVGYEDGTLQDDGTYVLRTLPTIYNLASDGVIL